MKKNQIAIYVNIKYKLLLDDFKKLIIDRESNFHGFYEIYITNAIKNYMEVLKYGGFKKESGHTTKLKNDSLMIQKKATFELIKKYQNKLIVLREDQKKEKVIYKMYLKELEELLNK